MPPLRIREGDTGYFWGTGICLGCMCLGLAFAIQARGHGIVAALLPPAGWLALLALQARSWVELADLGQGRIAITTATLFGRERHELALAAIVDVLYGGCGHGLGLALRDGGTVWLSVSWGVGRRLARRIRELQRAGAGGG